MSASLEERETWSQVEKCAVLWATSPDDVRDSARRGLHDAVLTYFTARQRALQQATAAPVESNGTRPTYGTSGRKLRSGHVVPFGRLKGHPIEEVSDKDLNWLLEAIGQSLADPTKGRWADQNQALWDAIRNELETR